MTAKVIHLHSRLPVTFSKRGKSCAQGAIGFGFRWLKNWCEIFKPISVRRLLNVNESPEAYLREGYTSPALTPFLDDLRLSRTRSFLKKKKKQTKQNKAKNKNKTTTRLKQKTHETRLKSFLCGAPPGKKNPCPAPTVI